MKLPRLYPILDAKTLRNAGLSIGAFGFQLRDAGIRFLQYRNKEGSDEAVLEDACLLRTIFPPSETTLVLNDRAHLLDAAAFDGLHIGQQDMPVVEARAVIGPSKYLGLSTHTAIELTTAAGAPVDYLAIGPVFRTRSKVNPDPVVGLAGIREARRLTDKPLVAIGGITLQNACAVLDAGADSIALISAMLPTPQRSIAKVLADFLSSIG